MKEYQNYKAEEFVLDEYFRKWAKGQLLPGDRYWENWIDENPSRREEVMKARVLVSLLQIEPVETDDLKIADRMLDIQESRAGTESPGKSFRYFTTLKIAASLLFCLGTAFYFIQKAKYPFDIDGAVSTEVPAGLIKRVNKLGHKEYIALPDGSAVMLYPKGKLSYSTEFGKNTREVYLVGEADFNVVKKTGKPFLVHTAVLITKVLGTKFTVKADNDKSDITVKVISGKVSVVTNEGHKQGDSEVDQGILLTPNQMAIFERGKHVLTKRVVEEPALLNVQGLTKGDFVFVDAPVEKVFKKLESAYGIPIIYDEAAYRKCTITAPLAEEGLYQKLGMICKVLNSSFEIIDGQIIINGLGCN